MVKAPNIVHLSILTSVGSNKKQTWKKQSQLNKVIIILYLHKVQNEKYFLDLLQLWIEVHNRPVLE